MQDGRKAVWSIPYVSVASFPSLKQNFIAYCFSKVSSCPDCILEIHQRQSGFIRVYSNCCCICWFEGEILKIGQSSHKMYNNNILKFQEFMAILNACTKKVWKLIEGTMYVCLYRWVRQITIWFWFCVIKNISVQEITLKNLLIRYKPWRFGECGVPLHYYCFEVHTGSVW